MLSPKAVRLKNLADVELAYRRLWNDVQAIESNQNTSGGGSGTAIATQLRRCIVQAVLDDRYLGVWVDAISEETASITYTEITTLAELHTTVRNNPKGRYRLMNDIDATADCSTGGAYYNSGAGWLPLASIDGGEGGNPDSGFQGIFDGNGFKITGIMCNRPSSDYQSFFGYVGLGGVVKNLTLENVDIKGKSCVAAFCGGVSGLLYNCHLIGTSTIEDDYTTLTNSGNAGAICGDNDGVLRLCTATGATIRGLRDVGGVLGDNDGLVQYCSFSGDVYVSVIGDAGLISGDNKGFIENIPMADMPVNKGTIFGCVGIGTVSSFDIVELGAVSPAGNIALGVGDNRGGKVSNCWVSGTVTGKNPDVAGFIGNNDIGDNSLDETKDSIISNCYALASVIPLGALPLEGTAAGFVGKNKGGQVFNCYSDSPVTVSGGASREHYGDFCANNSNSTLLGIITLSFYNATTGLIGTSDGGVPKTTSQMKQQATYLGWNFSTIWTINEGTTYPLLPELPEASDALEDGYFDVYPVERIGVKPLTGDVRPKVVPGNIIFAEECEDGVIRTPIIVEDLNFPVSRTDISDGAVGVDQLGDLAGGDIAGEGLRWDTNENLRINQGDGLSIDREGLLQVNQGFGLDINVDGELVVDPSDFNGSGLDYDETTGLLSVDLSEIPASTIDFQTVVDDTTIGFDDPKAYVAGKTYSAGEKCSDGGINYNSLQDSNTGNTPASSPTYWASIGTQKVLKTKEGIVGDGLSWSTNGKIQVNQGAGLDVNVSNELVVDLSEVTIEEARIFELSYCKASDSDLTSELSAVNAGGQIENGIFGQSFDASTQQAIVWSGYVPNDYKAGSNIVIKCRWCLGSDGDAGATAWRWYSSWNKVERADATVIGSATTSASTDQAVPAGEAQRTMHTITLATIATLESRDFICIALVRQAAHANDTCTKKIMVLDKIFAEYTADKL